MLSISSPSSSSSSSPIYLNVYDLTDLNNYLYWVGLGIFHSGIEVHGVEYAFGAHDYPTSGVFEVEPRNCPGFAFRRSIVLGSTDKDPSEFREFIHQISQDYPGDSYHLIAKNCNHFTNDLCMKLTKRAMPAWVNRLANLGALCSCLLPESLQVCTEHQTTEYYLYEGEDGEETMAGEEEVDAYDQGQPLLTTPNGNTQSFTMQDHLRDTTLKPLGDTL